jgi:hypothetical protein
MAKSKTEREAQAWLLGFLVKLLDEAGVIRGDQFAKELREVAAKDFQDEGSAYLLAVADGLEGKKAGDTANKSVN